MQPPLLVSKTHTQIDLASEEGTTRRPSVVDLPLLEYQHALPIHEEFVLVAEERLLSDAVNKCTMMMPLEREDWIQVALADAVQECLERVHIQALRSNSAKSVKDELKGKSHLEVGERVDVGQQILVDGGRQKMRDRWTHSSQRHSTL